VWSVEGYVNGNCPNRTHQAGSALGKTSHSHWQFEQKCTSSLSIYCGHHISWFRVVLFFQTFMKHRSTWNQESNTNKGLYFQGLWGWFFSNKQQFFPSKRKDHHWVPFNLLLKGNLGSFHTVVPYILILSKFYLPTDAQENCFKRSIKIYIKTAPTCFGVITIVRERTMWTCQSYNVKTVD